MGVEEKMEKKKEMKKYYFTKVKLSWEECIIVFEENGEGKPVCVFQETDINKLNEVWSEKNKKVPKNPYKKGDFE